MKITMENTLREFQAWSGAVGTKNTIISLGLEEQFEELIVFLVPIAPLHA